MLLSFRNRARPLRRLVDTLLLPGILLTTVSISADSRYVGANVSGSRFRLGPTHKLNENLAEGKVRDGNNLRDFNFLFSRATFARQPGVTANFAQGGVSYLDLLKNISYRGSVGQSETFTATRTEIVDFRSLDQFLSNDHGSVGGFRNNSRLEFTRYQSTVFRTDHDFSLLQPIDETGRFFTEYGLRFQSYNYAGNATPGLGIINSPAESENQQDLQFWRYPITSFSFESKSAAPAIGIGTAFSFLDRFSLTASLSLLAPIGQLEYHQEYLARSTVRVTDPERYDPVLQENTTRDVYIYDTVRVTQQYIGYGGTADIHLNWALGPIIVRFSGRYQNVVIGNLVDGRRYENFSYNSFFNEVPEMAETNTQLFNLFYDLSFNRRCGIIDCEALDFTGSRDELAGFAIEVLVKAF